MRRAGWLYSQQLHGACSQCVKRKSGRPPVGPVLYGGVGQAVADGQALHSTRKHDE